MISVCFLQTDSGKTNQQKITNPNKQKLDPKADHTTCQWTQRSNFSIYHTGAEATWRRCSGDSTLNAPLMLMQYRCTSLWVASVLWWRKSKEQKIDSASTAGPWHWGCSASIQEGGLEGVSQLSGGHTPQPSWETLLQGTGEENWANTWTSGSGRPMWFWNQFPIPVVSETGNLLCLCCGPRL